MYRKARHLVGQRADAEDLVQETCLRAFCALSQIRDPERVQSWLLSILRTTFLRKWTEDPYRRHVICAVGVPEAAADAAGVALELERYTIRQDVRRAVVQLPLVYREIVVLSDVAGCSYRELQGLLGLRPGTVMSRLHRGRRLLRDALSDYRAIAVKAASGGRRSGPRRAA